MLIGEVLIGQRKLLPNDLEQALVQKPVDERLCSFLITSGRVSFDDASRALGEQKKIACALQKHLDGRDPEIAKLIPAELGRASCVLPIGKTSKGAVIVCARDPSPAVMAQLANAIAGDILMVIAPATRLEQLVKATYGSAPTNEFDIDFDRSAGPRMNPLVAHRRPLSTPPMPLPRASTPPPLPPPPEMDALDPESVRFALTDLDDERVAKDPTQSGQVPVFPRGSLGTQPPSIPAAGVTESGRPATTGQRPGTEPPALPPRPATLPPASTPAPRPSTPLPISATPPLGTPVSGSPQLAPAKTRGHTTSGSYSIVKGKPGAGDAETAAKQASARATRPMSLQTVTIGLEAAVTREQATDVVLAYVATRWHAGLVLAIRDRVAVGYRGHAVTAPESITVSLYSPSTVQLAVQTRDVSLEAPKGVGQSALTTALNRAVAPSAAPVIVDGQPVAVLAVGDPIDGPYDRDEAAADLKLLAVALGAAYQRLHTR